ncbi:uncharacterized protein At3g60930, chloroplastic-like [Zingiber officinale]|uniref:uncharacterized protein At3g60930, chloroplastic-like n=1 Tax=Zingiber officinale TaxID=94328 RepID=UPI001C4ACDC7|nr:uncharacterized protein At3g60930, chloroplastic-like [Zingiber officinale]
MAEGNEVLWYSYYISDLDNSDLSQIRVSMHLTNDYQLQVPRPDEHSSSPPQGFVTFFKDQLLGGLCFSLHPIFSSLSQYFGIPLSQFTPNAIRAICGMVTLCRVYQIPLTTQLLHHFYSLKRSKPGVFMVQSRVGCKFFPDMPSSNKAWKSRFFFIRLPELVSWLTNWRSSLPLPFELPEHMHQPVCHTASEKIKGVRLLLSIILREGFLHFFGPSPVPAAIGAPFEAAMFWVYSRESSKLSSNVLKALGEEIARGLAVPSTTPSQETVEEPAESSGPLLLEVVLPEAGSVALKPIDKERTLSPSPDKRLRLQRKRKRVTPAVQSSPSLPPLGQASSKVPKVQVKTTRTPVPESSPVAEVPAPTPVRVLAPEQACSSSLSLIQFAVELLKENESLKSRIQELELPLTPRDPLDPLTADDPLDSYLHTVGASAQSARHLAQASSEKIKELQAILKTKLEEKESELAAFSTDLRALQESNKALQKDLGVARADLAISVDREKALQAQRDLDQATIKSLQVDLLKVQVEASTLKKENVLALAAADKVKVELVEYRSGENDHLKAYRISYVKSPFFHKKIDNLIDLMLCYGGVGAVRQLFKQGLLHSVPSDDFLDRDRLMQELLDEAFPSFIADDDFLTLPVPPPSDAPPTDPQL